MKSSKQSQTNNYKQQFSLKVKHINGIKVQKIEHLLWFKKIENLLGCYLYTIIILQKHPLINIYVETKVQIEIHPRTANQLQSLPPTGPHLLCCFNFFIVTVVEA